MNIDEARAALSKEIVERQRLQEENAELKKYINQLDKEQKSIDEFATAVHEEYKREIAELKRLLRLAVDDLAWSNCNMGDNDECPDCPYYSGKPGRCLNEWKHAKEAEEILKK